MRQPFTAPYFSTRVVSSETTPFRSQKCHGKVLTENFGRLGLQPRNENVRHGALSCAAYLVSAPAAPGDSRAVRWLARNCAV